MNLLQPQPLDLSGIALLVGILIANLGAIVAFFVGLKVSITRLEVRLEMSSGKLGNDIDNLGNLYRELKQQNNKEGKNEKLFSAL